MAEPLTLALDPMTLRAAYLPILLSVSVTLVGDSFPTPFNSEPNVDAIPPSPEAALGMIGLPEGFQVTVYAAEPDVRNPIAMAWDVRGRMWVAENYTYGE